MKLSQKQYNIFIKYVSYFIMVDCFLFVSKQIKTSSDANLVTFEILDTYFMVLLGEAMWEICLKLTF